MSEEHLEKQSKTEEKSEAHALRACSEKVRHEGAEAHSHRDAQTVEEERGR